MARNHSRRTGRLILDIPDVGKYYWVFPLQLVTFFPIGKQIGYEINLDTPQNNLKGARLKALRHADLWARGQRD